MRASGLYTLAISRYSTLLRYSNTNPPRTNPTTTPNLPKKPMITQFNVSFPTLVSFQFDTETLTQEQLNDIARTAWVQLCDMVASRGLSCLIVDYSKVDDKGNNTTMYGEVSTTRPKR